MRVLVLHQHYWPEIAATAQILSDLCEDLAANGHQVTVICGQPSYHSAVAGHQLPVEETHRGVQVKRVWSYAPKERGIPKRLLHYASYFGSSLAVAMREVRPDVCLVMSTPPLLLGISGALLATFRDVPFVYSVQDLYPDVAIHLGVISDHGPIKAVVDAVANTCYRSASALVTLSPGMARRLAAKGVDRDKVRVVPNWADTDSVRAAPRDTAFAREHGLADGFVVQYAGNLGRSQGLDCVIRAADLLRDLPITFAFVGVGNAKEALENEARTRNLDKVRFLPPQPRAALSDLLSACDVGLVPMKRAVGDDLVPSKLYGIMAAARPVLACVDVGSEVARVVCEHDCGWVVEPESAEALADGIRAAMNEGREERERRGSNGRSASRLHYSRTVLTRRYEEVLLAAAGCLEGKNTIQSQVVAGAAEG